MEIETDDERMTRMEARTAIYNQVQMVLGGHALRPALEALCDCLAVAVVMATGSDRAKAHALLDALLVPMKMTADNNLDIVAEHARGAGATGSA
jgi:hypothetical protein